MGFFSKVTKPFKKAAEAVTKPFAKITNKLIPNELRFLAPYAAGIGTLMLPPGMGPYLRAMSAMGLNTAGQIASDESATGDIDDINKFSAALSGGLGYLGADAVTQGGESGMGVRGGIEQSSSGAAAGTNRAAQDLGMNQSSVGFMQGAENVGREGVASLSDFVQGNRQTLSDVGSNPGDLFSSANKFKAARDVGKALGATTTLATGDVAYENAVDMQNANQLLMEAEAAEIDETTTADEGERATLQMTSMRQAGIPEETVEETLEMNGLSEYYVAPELAAYGGLMGRPNYEFGGITEALNNAGQRGLMIENKAMGGMMGGDPTYHQVRDLTGPVDLQGIMGYNMGGSVLPQGMEMDYRGGGFIPMGSKERADDVPARVSKNEFVMTADAVKAAGGGSVNQGAKRMYNLMNNLEARA